MVVVIKGAGDIASGIATRLYRSGFQIIMTDIENPTSIRNTVCFSQAIVNGETEIENIKAVKAENFDEALSIINSGDIAVTVDERAEIVKEIKPSVVVDAILAKKNLSTSINDSDLVIAVGPGFTAKVDCDVVIETMRGHNMGRVIYEGTALENTGVPGLVGGKSGERIIRATKDGKFIPVKKIGDMVKEGEIVAYVDEEPVLAYTSGVVRGMLNEGIKVYKGMKSGDVDPRGNIDYCYTCSDKALAIGGGVLEAILAFQKENLWKMM